MHKGVHERYTAAKDHWWFRARHRIFDTILDAEGVPAGARILDVGPGSGINLPILAPRGSVTVLDADFDSAHACRSAGATRALVGDAQRIPLADASIDLACALDVIEHVDDDRAALAELRRVCTPTGVLMVSVPAFPILWGRQDVLSEHRRRYRRRDLHARLTEAGFTVSRCTYFNTLLFPPIAAVRIASRPFLARSVSASKSDLDMRTPLGLDRILCAIFSAERHWLRHASLPFGVSLLATARPTRTSNSG